MEGGPSRFPRWCILTLHVRVAPLVPDHDMTVWGMSESTSILFTLDASGDGWSPTPSGAPVRGWQDVCEKRHLRD